MSKSFVVQLPDEFAIWLEQVAAHAGVTSEDVLLSALENARSAAEPNSRNRRFLRLAGIVDGSPDLSSRKGFAPRSTLRQVAP